ncbi:MAG: hypothetical protein JOY71_30980 [Acetobacteraceae bacterium]|nr:hypothetical protein [Acetobacteraceae bacterium]
MTGKRLKGPLDGKGYTVRTDDLMAEAGCLYHVMGSSTTSLDRSMSAAA